jgi:MinD superfamily P-loop ATPase
LAELAETEPFVGGRRPQKDDDVCLRCDLCRDVCRYEAIDDDLQIDPFACEACGLCARICPAGAIEMVPQVTGELRVSNTPYGPLVHSELGIGEEYSGKLVSEIRKRALLIAESGGYNLIIADGPPGIGCPVISSITGSTLALLVTEPSVSGIHDLDRIARVTKHFGIPSLVAVNKCDIDLRGMQKIEEYCGQNDLPIVGWIPFDRRVVRAVVNGRPPVLEQMSPAAIAISQLWEVVRDRLGLSNHLILNDYLGSKAVT